MNINELIEKKKELDDAINKLSELGLGSMTSTPQQETGHGAWVIGEKYMVRTVTHILTGRLVAYGRQEIVLDTAAWIADTGRFSQAVSTASFDEVEPYPSEKRVIVGRGGLIDAVVIDTLPTEQK